MEQICGGRTSWQTGRKTPSRASTEALSGSMSPSKSTGHRVAGVEVGHSAAQHRGVRAAKDRRTLTDDPHDRRWWLESARWTGGGEKWSDSRSMGKAEPRGLAEGLTEQE